MPCKNQEQDKSKSEEEGENKFCFEVNDFPTVEHPKHGLVNPIDNELEKVLPVWEMDCPPVENVLKLPTFPDGSLNISRESILQKFEPLQQDDEFAEWTEFWEWINELSDADLWDFHHKISSQLVGANGMVPTFNVIISHMTGSHNNVLLLGSTVQLLLQLFMFVPTWGKAKCHCWSLLQF